MVSLAITIPAEEPSQKFTESQDRRSHLQSGLIYLLNNFFGHLGNDVDVESRAAYNDLLILQRATTSSTAQMALIAKIGLAT